jgi:hypothetical protein
VPFADLFIYFFKADISDISVNLFHFSKFSFIGWITDNDRRRLFNLDDAERMPAVSFFNGAFRTYGAHITFLLQAMVTVQKNEGG